MAGISIDVYYPAGVIGGFVGFPVTISIINISMDSYSLLDIGNRSFKIIHKNKTQRFVVPTESKVEM